ncbi:MAG: prepilin-type N-terminal cleavage/methylation domain-containing protein [Verrucomicrobiaceae bacterium]|nr:MAG: prepilin-type N-terminal cleavage/methylation domain-containing protein [Verrucomicrobiaceae bacterium]
MRPPPPTMMKPRGVTLVEAVIVLAIIAVLFAVVYPVGRSMVAKSNEAVCLDLLRAQGVGLQSYLNENNDIMPELAIGRNSKEENVPVLDTVLMSFVGTSESFHCPQDKKQFAKTGCSYSWNHLQNGRRSSDLYFFGVPEKLIPLITDKEAWHPGGTNYLNADLSSSNRPRFVTSTSR